MSKELKRKYKKRNFHAEANYQIDLINKMEASTEFLMNVSTKDESDFSLPLPLSSASMGNISSKSSGKMHLTPKAKDILETWMYNHRNYCYPTKVEKQLLAIETEMSVQKVSNWFINSRRRMLPKMLEKEGKNIADFTISRKKKKLMTNATKVSEQPMDETAWATNLILDEMVIGNIPIVDENHILLEEGLDSNDASQATSIQETSPSTTYQAIKVPVSIAHSDTCFEPTAPITTTKKQNNQIIRGILFDERTNSKCLFIIAN